VVTLEGIKPVWKSWYNRLYIFGWVATFETTEEFMVLKGSQFFNRASSEMYLCEVGTRHSLEHRVSPKLR